MISIPGRIPVHIYPIFWVLIILLGWINSLSFQGTIIWSIVIFISVLVHEYGHALTALCFGQEAEINLVGFGGLTKRQSTKRLEPWQDFLVVFNGPLAGFALFFIAYQIKTLIPTEENPILSYALSVTILVNFFWTIVNLLPIQPLDGGKLLVVIMQGFFGFTGLRIALFISIVLGILISIFFFLIRAIIAGSIFLILTFESYRTWRQSLTMTEQDQDDTLQELLNEAEQAMNDRLYGEAWDKLMIIRNSSSKGYLFLAATHLLAEIAYQQDRPDETYELLKDQEKALSIEPLMLLQHASYDIGNVDEAITLGNKIYRQYPNAETAVVNAMCFAKQNRSKESAGWLETAVRDGLEDVQNLIEQKVFDPIRNAPEFLKFYHR